MRRASHIAAFLAGALVATALAAQAVPDRGLRESRDRYEGLDTFAQALTYIANHYVDEVDERELMYGAVQGMVDRLDPHSAFLPPKKYQRLRQDTEGEFGGVGITLRDSGEGEPPYPFVDRVVARSPAARGGVEAGDWVVAIGGDSTRESASPARSWHSKLRGRPGTRVSLDVMRRGRRRPHRLILVRERIKLPTVAVSELARGIGYISISKFQEATAGDVRAGLRRLQRESGRIRGLVLDLRGNPGGLLDQAVRTADLFIDEGLIVSIRSRRRTAVERERAHAHGTFPGFPLVVLVNRGSASAAEILAGALEDHRRATVVGERTYGKGSVQTFLDLNDGSGLKLTTSRYFTPSGRSLEGVGISPNVTVASGSHPPSEGGSSPDPAHDPQLSTAYRVLKRKLGAARP